MSARFLTTSAIMLLTTGPAFADCTQEVQRLEQAAIQAETGASSAGTGVPATKHQEEVLAGNQQTEESGGVAGGAGQSDVPASPHQQQALEENQGGAGNMAAEQQTADLITQARDMAEAGDEEGCMNKVGEAKSLLGID
jgi:hypothetical protein